MPLIENKGATVREKAVLQKYIDFLYAPQGPVLDVGCGDGTAVKELSQKGCQAIGLDKHPLQWHSTFKQLVIGDGYAPPFPPNTFDAVGCFTVLEHLTQPENFLREMVFLLKQGGKMVIAAPNMRGVFIRRRGSFVTQKKRPQQFLFNLLVYCRNWLFYFFAPNKISFDIKPMPDMTKIPDGASDYDARVATDFVTLKHFFKKWGLKLTYESCAMVYPEGRFLRPLALLVDRIPILRHFFGGLFIVGEKV